MLPYSNEVLTIAETAEAVEMIETAADKAQRKRIPRRRKKRFESDFFSPMSTRNAKQTKM